MLKLGKQKEKEFASFFNNVVFPTVDQDMKEHWDLNVKYDVKMLRRKNRHEEHDENIHWVEIMNVRGETGWLYGQADFFAFETIDYWIVVARDDLQEFVKNTVVKEQVYTPTLYRMYRRRDRKDIITLVKTIDLMYISSSVIRKPDDSVQ